MHFLEYPWGFGIYAVYHLCCGNAQMCISDSLQMKRFSNFLNPKNETIPPIPQKCPKKLGLRPYIKPNHSHHKTKVSKNSPPPETILTARLWVFLATVRFPPHPFPTPFLHRTAMLEQPFWSQIIRYHHYDNHPTLYHITNTSRRLKAA